MWSDFSNIKVTDHQAIDLFERTLCYQRYTYKPLDDDTANKKQKNAYYKEVAAWHKENTEPVDDYKKQIAKVNTLIAEARKQKNILFCHWLDYQDKLGSNLWALYNSCTHWATHTNEYANPANKRREREDKVAKMLQTKQWEYLANN